MNIKNMRRLVRRLKSRKNPVGLEMPIFFRHNGRQLCSADAICRAVEKHPCGTAGCIAGHAALLAWQSGDMPKKRGVDLEGVASEWLGLDFRQAYTLFRGLWPIAIPLVNITKPQAIAELERLIEAEK